MIVEFHFLFYTLILLYSGSGNDYDTTAITCPSEIRLSSEFHFIVINYEMYAKYAVRCMKEMSFIL